MTNSRLQISLVALTFFLVILGCVVPGLSPASTPAPTADTVIGHDGS